MLQFLLIGIIISSFAVLLFNLLRLLSKEMALESTNNERSIKRLKGEIKNLNKYAGISGVIFVLSCIVLFLIVQSH